MKISRRAALLGSVCLIMAGAGVAFALRRGGIKAHAQDVIGRVFGADVAAHPAALEFCEEYETFVIEKGVSGLAANAIYNYRAQNLPVIREEGEDLDRSVVVKFATSTNVVLASETGVELEYFGIFHPIEASCSNQLSYLGLP